jgi:hypothetical protein
MATQILNVRESGTHLSVGANSLAGDINVGLLQTSGNLNLGILTTRTGEINIGSNLSTNTTKLRGGSQVIVSAGPSGNVAISTETGGTIDIGPSAARTGTITIGDSTNAATTSMGGNIVTVDSGATTDITAGSTLALVSGTTTDITAGTDMTIGCTSSTGTLKLGNTITRNGTITVGNSANNATTSVQGRFIELNAGHTVDINANTGTGTLNLSSLNAMDIRSTGNTVTVEGHTGTWLGAQTVTNTPTHLGPGSTSGDITVGMAHTTGAIKIGSTITGRTTATIDVGTTAGTTVTNVKGNTLNLLSGAGDLNLTSSSGTIAVGSVNVNGGAVTGVSTLTTSGNITATSGDIIFGGNLNAGTRSFTITSGSSPGALTFNGQNISAVGSFGVSAQSGGGLYLTGGSQGIITNSIINSNKNIVLSDNATAQSITKTSNNLTIEATAGVLTVNSAATSDLNLGTSQTSAALNIGNATARTGNIVIGDATMTGNVLVRGIDINPVATTVTQVLGGTSGTNFVITGIANVYRWGKMAVLRGSIAWSSKGTAAGTLTLSGIADADKSVINNILGSLDRGSDFQGGSASGVYTCTTTAAGNTLNFYNDGTLIDSTNCKSTGAFRYSITYHTL